MRPLAPILLLLCAVPAFPADSWTLPLFSSAPGDVYDAAQKIPAPADADLFLIDVHVTLSMDSAGRLSEHRSSVFRIDTDLGAKQFSNFSEPWMAWRQTKPVLRARVITSDKQAHLLDPATVTEAGLPGVNETYGDVKVIQAPLPAVGRGCVIEIQVDAADRESVMPGARFERYPAAVPYPIHHFVVDVASPKPILAEARGFEKITREQKGEGFLRFEAWDMKKREPALMLPPESPTGPEIAITTAASWQSVARWYLDLTEPLLAKPAASLAAESDRASTIRSILADIQKNVRYTGLELGMGAYLPRTPAETLSRGYGDCKDKATLLISRLRAAAIPAEYALLTPFPFADVVPSLPGVEAFNHVIVYLPGPHPQWIDPTSQFTPASRLPLNDQGRSALIVDARSTALVRTPESAPADNRLDSELTIRLQSRKKANFSDTETYRGASEEYMRSMMSVMLASPPVKEKLEAQMSRLLHAEKITAIDSNPPADVDKPFEVQLTGEGLTQAFTNGQVALATLPFDRALLGGIGQLSVAKKDEDKKEAKDVKPPRKQDYFVMGAISSEKRYIVIPPPGFSVKQVPEVRDIDLGVAKLERTAALRPDNAVVIVDRFTAPKRRFTVAEAETIAGDLEKLQTASTLNIEFVDRVQQLLSDGKDKEALSLARERVAASPKSADALIRLASTLSATGANLEAIETCLRATALDPKSSEAFTQLADLYARDEAGRPFHAGMHRGKAIEAAKRAIDLDPDNKQLILKLSGLYNINDKAVPGGDGANLAESVSALRKIEKELPKLRAANSLPNALLLNRQFEDVKTLYAKGDAEAAISFRIAAIAASENPEAAVTAFDSSGSRESREKTFRDAAQALVQLNEYQAAGALIREAVKDDSAEGAGDADLLAKTHPRAQAKFSREAPVALVQHLIYALLDLNDSEDWRQLYASDSSYLTLRAERVQVLRVLAAYRLVARIRLSWATTADVTVSNGVFSAEGAPEVGFRVRMADPSSNGVMKTLAWVAKRGDDYRILGAGGDWAIPGLEALAALNRNDLKAARQWLDWMREELPRPSATDPLGTIAFTKLWNPEATGLDEAKTAAASLAARGRNYQEALPLLREAQKRVSTGPLPRRCRFCDCASSVPPSKIRPGPSGSEKFTSEVSRFGRRLERRRARFQLRWRGYRYSVRGTSGERPSRCAGATK